MDQFHHVCYCSYEDYEQNHRTFLYVTTVEKPTCLKHASERIEEYMGG